MKRSLISLAVIAASGQAHVIAPADKIDYIKKIRGRDDLNPVSLADRKPRDVRPIHIGGGCSVIGHGGGSGGIKVSGDESYIKQWPNTGVAHDRHTPAWMAAASKRPVHAAALA